MRGPLGRRVPLRGTGLEIAIRHKEVKCGFASCAKVLIFAV
jgi:hypothetical protein